MFATRSLLLIGLIGITNAYTQHVNDVELILDPEFTAIGPQIEVGKGPYWDDDSQLFYWTCKTDRTIFSYCPETGEVNTAVIDTDSTPLIIAVPLKGSKDSFVVGIATWIGLVTWDGRCNTTVKVTKTRELETSDRARLNDLKADPYNRLWATTMGNPTHSNPDEFYEDVGSVYMVDYDCNVHTKASPLHMANGLDWSPEADKMYVVDSRKYCLYQYEYNITDGSIWNPKVVFDFAAHGLVKPMNSLPVGLTVDNEGMIWVAMYATPAVVRINPHTGKLLAILVLQGVKQVTSVTWGGPKLQYLFVTTSSIYFDDEMRHTYCNSGKLIKVEGLGVTGLRHGTPAVLNWKE